MNVYDEAHSLAQAIKESGEFKEFDRLRKLVDEDKEISDMLKERGINMARRTVSKYKSLIRRQV